MPFLTAFFLVLLFVFRLGARRWQGSFLRPTLVAPFLFFYLLAAAVGYLISPAPELGLPKLTTLALGAFGYYLALDWLNGKDDRIWLFLHLLLAVSGGLVALMTPFMMRWPSRQIVDLSFLAQRIPHLTGDFSVHSNEIGGTLLFLLPFAAALFFERGRHRRRWQMLSLLLVVLILTGLFLAQSRSTYVGLLLAGAAALAWSRLRPAPIVVGIAVLSLLLLSVISMTGIDGADISGWMARIDAQTKPGPDRTTSWAMRREIWRAGGSMLGDYPVFGAGLYAFAPVSKANYPFEAVPARFSMTHAHNLFLQTAATLGLPALVALLGLWATLLQGLWTAGKKGGRPFVYAASLVGYLTFNSLDMIALGQRPGILMWIILAGATVTGGAVRAPAGRWKEWAPLLLGSGLALTPLLSRNVANWRLDQVRLAGQEGYSLIIDAYQGDPRRQGLVSLLQGDVDRALSLWRGDPHAVVFLQSQGLLEAAAEEYEVAMTWYDLALELDKRRASPYYWRGMAQLRLGALEDARDDFQRARNLAPENGLDESWQAMVLFYEARSRMGRGDWEGAVRALRKAIALDGAPDHYKLLGDALFMAGDEEAAAAAHEMARQKLRR